MGKELILPQVRNNFKIDSLVYRPQNIGVITKEDAKKLNGELFIFHYGKCHYAYALTIYWVLNKEERIIDAKMTLFGESEFIAAASIAALVSKNKTPQEILAIKEKGIEYFLREHPQKAAMPKLLSFITNVVTDALYMAARAYLKEEIKDETVVDNATGATLRFINETIERLDIKDLDYLRYKTGAGLYDKSVIAPGKGDFLSNYYLEDILKKKQEQMKESKKVAKDKPFAQMNIEEKRAAIEAAIDQYIRQMLVMDGGDMEILDIKENGTNTDIYIRYLGACSGCASASTGTLFAIEGILRQKIDPNIRVIPI